MSKKYHIVYEGFKTEESFEGYAQINGDDIIFKNLTGGKDFKLNRLFFNEYQIENNVIFIR